MSPVQFSGSAHAADRRRRRLATEIEAEINVPESSEDSNPRGAINDVSPFPMLSRDRLIRRVVSPRLWKHVAVAIVLTLTPIIYAAVTWPSAASFKVPDQTLMASRIQALRGLSGLNFFAAAQLCLVIAWVRSASAVDFRGGYRWWRWASAGLFIASLTLLTDSNQWIMNITAERLEPLFGRIDAARPALILVPCAAYLAFILWRLIPDMGRCRSSQSLLVISVVLLGVRAFAGARQNSTMAAFPLSTLDLLISGVMLSSLQLHARFVIHVNPNPPLALKRTAPAVKQSRDNETAPVQEANETQQTHVANGRSDESSNAADNMMSIGLQSASAQEPSYESIAETTAAPQGQPIVKTKAGKKQKYRKAG